MLEPVQVLTRRRRSLRRACRLRCEVLTNEWAPPVPHTARDLSEFGMWLDTPYVSELPERLIVRFTPPGWGPHRELRVPAVVRRIATSRQVSDHAPSGMAVEFLEMEQRDQRALAKSLSGRPPPLPVGKGRRYRTEHVWVETVLTFEEERTDRFETVEVSEKLGPLSEEAFSFRALGGLLSGAARRRPAAVPPPLPPRARLRSWIPFVVEELDPAGGAQSGTRPSDPPLERPSGFGFLK